MIVIVVKVAFMLCKSMTGPGTVVKNRLYNSHIISIIIKMLHIPLCSVTTITGEL